MRKPALRLAAFLALLVLPAALQAQNGVSARAWVDSTDYLIGDPITVHVVVTHPGAANVQPAQEDSLVGFTLLGRIPAKPEGDTATATGVVVARYDSGSAAVPPLVYFFTVPGSAPDTVSTNPVAVTIHTVPVDTSKAFMDLKPPMSVPVTLADIAVIAGIVLLIGALAYLGYRLWKKRKQKAKGEVYVPPAKPAHALAFAELARLREKKLWQQGLIKQYYSEATEILRRYIERRYALMALEETTDQIMEGLRTLKLEPEVCEETERILRRADLVKFAKYLPDVPEHEETFSCVHDIVEKTKVVPMTPVPGPDGKAASHVGS